MKTIYKYQLRGWHSPYDKVEVSMPKGAVVRHVAMQPGHGPGPMLWCECSAPSPGLEENETRTFFVYGTGREIKDDHVYRGTVLIGDYVWHVYEEVTCPKN